MNNVLLSTEIDFFIETMKPQSIWNIGSIQWLEWHQRIQKLNQQAIIEASKMHEEQVKEALVTHGKISVLVHEAILINIWKHKILPKMLKLEPHPTNTFMAYTVLYHEAVCVALLELVMFHENCCETLVDYSADLLDYAAGVASLLLTTKYKEVGENETTYQELARQLNNLNFDIGMRCLTIIRYLCDNLDRLPLDFANRVYASNDIPVLFTEILLSKPWIQNGKQYVGGKWMQWDGEALGQVEAQVWLALRQLLLHPACQTYYNLTNTRKTQLLKLQMLLTEVLLDQLSPLVELKKFISRVGFVEQTAQAKPILLETVLEIKQRILNEIDGKWKKIAQEQMGVIFCKDQKTLIQNAQMLSEAYNADLLEKMESNQNLSNACEQCGKSAVQRCSQCKKAWYCSRNCQVKHWPIHNCIG